MTFGQIQIDLLPVFVLMLLFTKDRVSSLVYLFRKARLQVGDAVVCGEATGTVKSMQDTLKASKSKAGRSIASGHGCWFRYSTGCR